MNNNRARSFMQIRSSRGRSRSKRGVSPVIGVILMVAATIVIAGVVMGMLGGFGPPSKTYSVSVTAEEDSSGTITVTYKGGPDAAMLASIDDLKIDGKSVSVGNLNPPTVGNSTTATGDATVRNHVIVTGTFKDGTKQVILDTWV